MCPKAHAKKGYPALFTLKGPGSMRLALTVMIPIGTITVWKPCGFPELQHSLDQTHPVHFYVLTVRRQRGCLPKLSVRPKPWFHFSCSVVSDLYDPMDCSTPGFPVHHQLPELAQTHVHWVGDAIQPSHPLSSPSPPAVNLSQHQGLVKWVSSSHQVAKVLEFQPQHQSFQWTPRTDFL